MMPNRSTAIGLRNRRTGRNIFSSYVTEMELLCYIAIHDILLKILVGKYGQEIWLYNTPPCPGMQSARERGRNILARSGVTLSVVER